MPGRLASSSSKMPPTKRRRKQQGGPSIPPLPPRIADDDVDVSDEDLDFVRKHKAYAGFLAKLDTKPMTRQVLGLTEGKDEDDLETRFEKGAQRAKDSTKLSVDPVDVLPVKTLGGQLHYRTTETGDPVDWLNVSSSERRALVQKGAKTAILDDGADGARVTATGVDDSWETKSKAEKRKERKQLKRKEYQEKKEAGWSSEVQTSADLVEADLVEAEDADRGVQLKARMAEIGMALLADPNSNIMTLQELQEMCADRDEGVSQLALLSSLAVFKDLIPGYRIRLPTEKERGTTVSKEVRALWDYETALLRFYQAYVQILIKYAKVKTMRRTAVKCLCGLLEAVPHFNYRDSILGAIVPRMDSNDDDCSIMSCNAVESLFENPGKHGEEGTVEAVQLIADFVRLRNCHLHPKVIQVYLCLSFDVDLLRYSISGVSGQSSTEGAKKIPPKMSKRQEKKDKKAKKRELASVLRKQVQADFKEASVMPEVVARKKVQMLILSSVFETYFRILKTSMDISPERATLLSEAVKDGKQQLGPRPLLKSCLEGLGKFSHLINVDFMADLLKLLQALAKGGNRSPDKLETTVTVWERLQCCTVACSIVRLNMDALNIDLREFYTIFYNLLPEAISVRDGENSGEMFAQALQMMLWDGRQGDMHRVAAFVKRLSTLALQLGSKEAVAALVSVQQLLVRYKKCRDMVENSQGSGQPGGSIEAMQTEDEDPDLSDALSTTLWELPLLAQHYNPDVTKHAVALCSMSNSSSLAIPTETPSVAMRDTSPLFPIVAVPSKTKQQKQSKSNKQVSSQWTRWMTKSGFQDVSPCMEDKHIRKLFSSHFKLMRACETNQRQQTLS